MDVISLRMKRLLLLLAAIACLASPAFAADATLPAKPIPLEEVNPRMTTSLQVLSRTARVNPAALVPMAEDLGIRIEGDMVEVIVEPVSGRVDLVDETAVRMLGGEVLARSESLMRVRVPAERLEAIADQVSGVAFIREPYPVRPLAVTSQGVALTGAEGFHDAGYYGQAVKVAIIDLGFDGLAAAQAAGELQNVVYTWDYIGDDSNVEGTGEVHGTGVAEVVEDMAPQAELYLLLISDSVDLANATQYCIDNGIRVINHSVGWFNSNFYDGTGTVAGIANNARENGILWVNAAGNDGDDGHWQGFFADGDGDGFHEFPGSDEGNRIYISSSDAIYVYLTWDDWPVSDQDYDLCLYNSNGDLVAISDWPQEGSQLPIEKLNYAPASDTLYPYIDGYYDIAIVKYFATGPMEMEFFTFRRFGGDPNLEHHVPESSINTPANSSKVVAVGAISYWNWTTGPQASYSSLGPSNTGLTKPDIAGPAAVLNTTYGGFGGTSASSPHVAGAAALLLSENSSRTANDLQSLLEGSAIDMGDPGKDNVYGSGRLNLELTPTVGTAAVFRVDNAGNVYADGAFYGAGFLTGSADVAEWVAVSEPVEPGDVLELDPNHPNTYRKSSGACSPLVAGVVSTSPGVVLGSSVTHHSSPITDAPSPTTHHSPPTDSALMALIGIVPVKACDEGGPIEPGDLLVSSSIPGHAMRWDPENHGSCDNLVGKALEPLANETGVIQVLLMR